MKKLILLLIFIPYLLQAQRELPINYSMDVKGHLKTDTVKVKKVRFDDGTIQSTSFDSTKTAGNAKLLQGKDSTYIKANWGAADAVKLTTNQTITGEKTFSDTLKITKAALLEGADIATSVNGGINNKKDFLWNYDSIPNVETWGVPNVITHPNRYYLMGMYYRYDRNHFRVGRINEKDAFPTTDAQYSFVTGWGTHAVDPNETVDGFQSKGNFVSGYQCTSAGRYGTNSGFNNILGNGGTMLGWGNWSGGIRYQINGQTFTYDTVPGIVTVSGNVTSVFTANKIVACKIHKSTDETVTLNRVVSSSYSAPNTTIYLKAPLPFLYVNDVALDLHDKLNYSWITTLGEGTTGGTTLGIDNFTGGNYSTTLGVANYTFNNYGVAIGKQAYTRNYGEIAMGSGMIINGTNLRFSQKSEWHLKGYTTSITPLELTLSSEAVSQYVNTLSLQNNTTVSLRIRVVAYTAYYQEGWAKYWDNVVIVNPSNNTPRIVVESTPVTTSETNTAAFNAAVTVGANGKVLITVTGIATREVDWTAWVEGIYVGIDAPSKIN